MKFTKMQALGNDYIYINAMKEKVKSPSELARKLSDRHFGIGGDGVIFIDFSEKADVKMRMYNSDGTEGKLCGNGIRCVAKYVYDNKIVNNNIINIETYNRIIETKIFQNKDKNIIRADMGSVKEGEKNKKIIIGEKEYSGDYIFLDNAHLVVYAECIEEINLAHCDSYAQFNIEVVSVLSRNEIHMRVKEKGSGETMACGTGACAAAVSCMMRKNVDNCVHVKMPGGNLFIEKKKDHVFMTGEAKTVFEGEIDICLL
ncbi:diaminopimelate epimerase [Faecalimonas sp.]